MFKNGKSVEMDTVKGAVYQFLILSGQAAIVVQY